MSDIRFDNRVAVVTGSGAGLGRSHALELAKRGARVVVNDLGSVDDGSGKMKKAADLVVEEIQKSGGTAIANYDSVATVAGGENIIKTAIDNFGQIDILVNNAGIVRDSTIKKMTEENWDLVMNVHLKGTYCVTKPALEYMKEKNYGRIVFTTSGVGLFGNFGQANYAAAKMGMVGLMNVIRLEMSKYNITCNTIAPNAATGMTEDILTDASLYDPKFVSSMVMCLSSEECSDTGMIFNCFSGWFSRVSVMCHKGVLLGDGKRDISPEEVRQNWKSIISLDDPKALDSIVETFSYIQPLQKK